MAFADNLRKLPGVSHLAALKLLDADGNVVGIVEHKPGQIGSLAIYNHLAQIHGAITPAAARQGLGLYGEHADEARALPGKHPHIDRLIALIESGNSLRVKHDFAL